MAHFLIKRDRPFLGATMGRLYLVADFGPEPTEVPICRTLECPHERLDDVRPFGIPCGSYGLSMTYSPKFKRMLPLVTGVYGRDGIRFHAGNSVSDTSGCILVGVRNNTFNTIVHSKIALDFVIAIMKVEKINKLVIVNNYETIKSSVVADAATPSSSNNS